MERVCMALKIGQGGPRLHYLSVNRRADACDVIGRTGAATGAACINKEEFVMTSQNTFLRYALLADAVASGATGLLMIAGADALTGLLGLPVALTREAGLVLVPYVALVAFVGTREAISRAAVRVIIALNVLWVLGSVAVLFAAPIAPTALGYAFVIAQAVAVGVFAELQVIGLRREAAMG
jgi:hypothetical protein